MDLPCLAWQRRVEKKWTQLPPSARTSFSSLTDVEDIFLSVQSRIDCDDAAFLSSVSEDCELRKDSVRAGRLREQGNASFRARDFVAAALRYSQALCYAALGSDQIALCYANRSAALFHLSLHQECLEDICRALDHDYPTHLQQKLLERRQQCFSRLGQLAAEKGGSKEKRVSTTLEDEWTGVPPHLSPKVLFCFSPEKGRHLVAGERISAGEVVLEERAFGSVLIPGTACGPGAGKSTETGVRERAFGTEDLHCHHCLCQTRNPVPCPGCSYARYCGEACQQEAWEGHHRWECSVAAELQAVGVLAHLALRMAFRAGFEAAQQVRGHPVGPATNALEMPNKTVDCVTMKGSGGREQISSQDSTARNENPGDYCSRILDPPLDGSYVCVHRLLPHVSGHAPSLRFLCAATAAVLCQRLRQAGSLPLSWRRETHAGDGHSSLDENEDWSPELSMLGAVILRHILQLRCNAQAVTVLRDSGVTKSAVSSVHEVRIATAVFPTLSLLNHSCSPNTSLAFGKEARRDRAAIGTRPNSAPGGVTITVRATQTVGPGQELQHCYGPHCSRMPVKERQQLLLEQYFFLCQCEACSQDLASKGEGQRTATAPGLQCTRCKCPLQRSEQGYLCSGPNCGHHLSHAELNHRLQELQELLDKATQLIQSDHPDKAAGHLQAALDKAERFLLETHPLLGQLTDMAARAQAAMGDWQQAAVHLSRTVDAIQCQYGEDSAELGQQLFKLVQLYFNGREARKALPLIPKAMRLLSLHFGPCCEEVEELHAMENYLQRAL